MLIRETEEFIEKVLENNTYDFCIICMNRYEKYELDCICENMVAEGNPDDYREAYLDYRYELIKKWGSIEELKKNYRIPLHTSPCY